MYVEIFFIFGDDGLLEVVPIAGMDQDDMIRALRGMLVERDGYAIHIAEATAWNFNDAAKIDSLLVIAESRNGLSEIWFKTVTTRGEEKLLLDAVKVDGSRIDGRFVGIFSGM